MLGFQWSESTHSDRTASDLVMSKIVACTELSALREHQRMMTNVWGQYRRPNSALRLEADFAMDLAVRLLDLHRYWCVRCRMRIKPLVR